MGKRGCLNASLFNCCRQETRLLLTFSYAHVSQLYCIGNTTPGVISNATHGAFLIQS